jgi:hypothetical protein
MMPVNMLHTDSRSGCLLLDVNQRVFGQSTRLRRTIPRSKACDICGLKTRCWDDAGEYEPFKWAKEVSKSENMGGIWKLQFQL